VVCRGTLLTFPGVFRPVFEFGLGVQEHQVHSTHGSVALFRDDQFGQAAQVFAIAVIDLLAKDETTTSASCSMEPDSRRSLSCGR